MTNSRTSTRTSKLDGESADVTITGSAATSLVGLLELCDQFLRTASPAVRTELHAFLASQPNQPDANWLIDMLGFNALYLQGKLTPTDHTTEQAGDRS